MKKERTITLNENDINNINNILLQAKADNLLSINNLTNYNLDNQYCIISEQLELYTGNDDLYTVDCVYYPNNVLIFGADTFKIIRIYKNMRDEFICDYEYTDSHKQELENSNFAFKRKNIDKIYNSVLESLFIDNYELDMKRELEKNIKNYENELKLLKSVKRVKTKANTDFKILSKNFTSDLAYNLQVIEDYTVYNKFNRLELKINDTNYWVHEPKINTIDDIENILIPAEVARLEKFINNEQLRLKNLHETYAKIKSLKIQMEQVATDNKFSIFNFYKLLRGL